MKTTIWENKRWGLTVMQSAGPVGRLFQPKPTPLIVSVNANVNVDTKCLTLHLTQTLSRHNLRVGTQYDPRSLRPAFPGKAGSQVNVIGIPLSPNPALSSS